MQEKYQKQLHSIVSELQEIDINNAEFETYKSVLSMVYSLIENNRIEDLDLMLRQNFPRYYASPVPLILHEN